MSWGLRRQANGRKAILAITASLLMVGVAPIQSMAGEIAEAFRGQAASLFISRDVRLRDLGITQPIPLNVFDSVREIYFPVPMGIPLVDASLDFDGNYQRGEGGRTTFIASLDGYAVSSRSFTAETGDAGFTIGVDNSPRPNGFVRLSLKWSSFVSENVCDNEHAIGNILQILPSTTLSYRYDSSLIKDLGTAWAALPNAVTVLVSGQKLSQSSYDSAWRMGVALERTGKKVSIKALPQVGDTVDLAELRVPAALRVLPAFAHLPVGQKHVIKDSQEAAGLLLIAAANARPDLVIVDADFVNSLNNAFDILKKQSAALDSEAVRVLDDMRNSLFAAIPKSFEQANANEVRFDTFAGVSLIALGSEAGAQAAGLFDRVWQKTAVSRSLKVNTVENPATGAQRLSARVFGRDPINIDVLERADWSAVFDLSDVGVSGEIPREIDVNVATAPGATKSAPVATVYLNDYLLGAKQLDPDGSRQIVKAFIPYYALKPQNILRVQFLRQRYDNACKEKALPFPAAVLPSSQFYLETAPDAYGFSTLMAWLSGETTLFVPQNWMDHASESLPGLIKVATASGVSPVKAQLVVQTDKKSIKPERPFIAFDTSVEGAEKLVDVQDGRVVLTKDNGSVFYDVAGLNGLALVNVASANGHSGLVYRTVGAGFLTVGDTIQWASGDIAVLGPKGVLAYVNTHKEDDFLEAYKDEPLSLMKPSSWMKYMPLIGIGFVAAFVLLLLRARQVRRRQMSNSQG